MKSYNLEGAEKAGQTLVGNWFEEREWKEKPSELVKTGHGQTMLLYGPTDQSGVKTEYQISYAPPTSKHRRLPPRQEAMERAAKRNITQTLKQEQTAQEDHNMYFTRGRYLDQLPAYDPNMKFDYLTDPTITLYSENGWQKGKDSHFSKPIQDYLGHQIVKDD